MSIAEKLKPRLEKDPDKIEVTPDEFQQLLSEPDTIVRSSKPKPPIKSEKTETHLVKERVGFFFKPKETRHEVSFTEYDNDDPHYLKKLAEWEAQDKTVNEVYYRGKRVVIVDSHIKI